MCVAKEHGQDSAWPGTRRRRVRCEMAVWGKDDRWPATGTLADARYVEHIVHADVGQPQLLHLSAYVFGAGLLLSRWCGNFDQTNPFVNNGGRAVVDGLERLSDGWFLDHPWLEPVVLSREQRRENECCEEDAEGREARDHVTHGNRTT